MRLLLIHTGGTLMSSRGHGGGAPLAPDAYTRDLLAELPVLRKIAEIETTILFNLDSSNIQPHHWVELAHAVHAALACGRYDGVVVVHGTDTMAYTASALPFMLHGLGKPVIITGSQIPLCEIRNDARENLITSLMIAADYAIPEVCLYFGGKLLRGCRAVKVSASGFAAFDSPNFPPLGNVGIDIDIEWELVRPRPRGAGRRSQKLKVQELGAPVVSALRLFPGISPELVRNVLRPPLQGLVLEAYGVGNGPDQNTAFLDALAEAT
ncbi:MAG TPA: asparaginase, partial [Minicystis sp.]|nr:asparaginase [Minicystis sp.]